VEGCEVLAVTCSVRVGKRLAKALSAYLGSSMYLNRSDFLRDAIREKLEREAPELLEPEFRRSSD